MCVCVCVCGVKEHVGSGCVSGDFYIDIPSVVGICLF